MIGIDLSKQEALDFDPKAIHQISFTSNLDRDRDTTMFSFTEEVKETILDFSQKSLKALWVSSYVLATARSTVLFCFSIISL